MSRFILFTNLFGLFACILFTATIKNKSFALEVVSNDNKFTISLTEEQTLKLLQNKKFNVIIKDEIKDQKIFKKTKKGLFYLGRDQFYIKNAYNTYHLFCSRYCDSLKYFGSVNAKNNEIKESFLQKKIEKKQYSVNDNSITIDKNANSISLQTPLFLASGIYTASIVDYEDNIIANQNFNYINNSFIYKLNRLSSSNPLVYGFLGIASSVILGILGFALLKLAKFLLKK